jgi:acyl-CoA reductase-like NAD-dependent aldehyde dehydrogenase
MFETCFVQVVQRARDAFEAGRTRSIDFREQQLQQLLRMYEENTTEMVEALAKDLRKVGGHNSIVELTHIHKYTNSFYEQLQSTPQRNYTTTQPRQKAESYTTGNREENRRKNKEKIE